MPIWKSVKQNIIAGENKTLVREKKSHKSNLFQIWIMTLINFGPLIFATKSKSAHQGFSDSVREWNKNKDNYTKLTFEIVWSKTLVREKTCVIDGDNLKKLYFTLVWTLKFQTCYSKTVLVTFFKYFLWLWTFVVSIIQVLQSIHIFLSH